MSTVPEIRRTRIAVFGSVAAQRPPSPAVSAVLEQVYDAIAASARVIAAPVIERAVEEGRITRRERHELLLELGDPSSAPGAGVASIGAQRVLREALAAIRRAAPAIAAPILDDAVADERLTYAQEARILDRLRMHPASLLRGPAAAGLAGSGSRSRGGR
jgi:hypothetical protein